MQILRCISRQTVRMWKATFRRRGTFAAAAIFYLDSFRVTVSFLQSKLFLKLNQFCMRSSIGPLSEMAFQYTVRLIYSKLTLKQVLSFLWVSLSLYLFQVVWGNGSCPPVSHFWTPPVSSRKFASEVTHSIAFALGFNILRWDVISVKIHTCNRKHDGVDYLFILYETVSQTFQSLA